jgi:hypothetical protein
MMEETVDPDGELVVTYLDGKVEHHDFATMGYKGWHINMDWLALVVQEAPYEESDQGGYQVIPLMNVRSIRLIRNSKAVSEALRRQSAVRYPG